MRYVDADKLVTRMSIIPVEECHEYNEGWKDAAEAVANAPTADVAPVVHGEWKYDGYRVCRCSVCGDGLEYLNSYYDPASDFNYCQNCGAKMDEVSDDE